MFPHWATPHFTLIQLNADFVCVCVCNILWHNLFNNWNRDQRLFASMLLSHSIISFQFFFFFSLSISKTTKIDTCSKLEGFQDRHWNNCQIISVHFAKKKINLQGSRSVAKARQAAPSGFSQHTTGLLPGGGTPPTQLSLQKCDPLDGCLAKVSSRVRKMSWKCKSGET